MTTEYQCSVFYLWKISAIFTYWFAAGGIVFKRSSKLTLRNNRSKPAVNTYDSICKTQCKVYTSNQRESEYWWQSFESYSWWMCLILMWVCPSWNYNGEFDLPDLDEQRNDDVSVERWVRISDYKYQHERHTLGNWSFASVMMSLRTLDNRCWSYWIEVQSREIVNEVISSAHRTLLNHRMDQGTDYYRRRQRRDNRRGILTYWSAWNIARTGCFPMNSTCCTNGTRKSFEQHRCSPFDQISLSRSSELTM